MEGARVSLSYREDILTGEKNTSQLRDFNEITNVQKVELKRLVKQPSSDASAIVHGLSNNS